MQGLKGRTVLVANAATGLGAASAQRLAQEGAARKASAPTPSPPA
jgi:NAD(P)-dependent dehydrogenase (short-subunit alcohol dehydrogenase family)